MTTQTPFQSLLASTTADAACGVTPHHPLVCMDGKLYLEEDNTFHCEHASVGPDDYRTKRAIIHSIACLIIEEAYNL